MMTKQSSRTKVVFKKLAVIPVLVTTIFLFAERVEANEIMKDNIEEITSKKDTLMPPPPKTGFHEKNGKTLFYVKNKKGTIYYNKYGQLVTKRGEILNSEQTKSDNVIPNQNISKIYKDNKVAVSFKRSNIPPPPKANFPKVKASDISNIPPPPSPRVEKGKNSNIPPPPQTTSAFELVSKYPNANYFHNDKKISFKKALRIARKEKELSVLTQFNKHKKVIKFTSKN